MTTKLISNISDTELLVNGQSALKFNKNGLITTPITVRQTVELGTVDTNGFSAFGGSTGSTVVTAATTLYATAANGMFNLRGSSVNPSWSGLSINGTMYLYLDIAADGTCTTGASTLAPVYQHGGVYSIVSGQFTFNIQEMSGKVGNGVSAAQTYRVYVGEVVVSGGVVASIIWYALNGRYKSTASSFAFLTAYTFSHNIGILAVDVTASLVNTVLDLGYTAGQIITTTPSASYETTAKGTTIANLTNNSCQLRIANILIIDATNGVNYITATNWNKIIYAKRPWGGS